MQVQLLLPPPNLWGRGAIKQFFSFSDSQPGTFLDST